MICTSPISHYFPGTNPCVNTLLRDTGGQEKTLKFLGEGVLLAASEIAIAAGASSDTLQGLNTSRDMIKTARDVLSFFNIFRGIVPDLLVSVRQVKQLTWKSANSQQTDDAERGILLKANNPKYNERVVGTAEKVLKVGSLAFKSISAWGYILGFGVNKPTAVVRKYYFKGDCGAVGNSLAGMFPHVMCGVHVAGAIDSSLEMAYQFKAYNRASTKPGFRYNEDSNELSKAVMSCSLDLLEKIGELLNDTLILSQAAAPPLVRVGVGLFYSGMGFIKACRKAADSVAKAEQHRKAAATA